VEDMFVAKYQQHPSTTTNGKNEQQQQQQKKNKKTNKQSKKNDAAAGGDGEQQGQGQQGQQGQPGLDEHEDGSAWSFVVPLNPPTVRKKAVFEPFSSRFILKKVILPRQARDKHMEALRNEGVFRRSMKAEVR
jgi:hypothetical protein